MVEVIADVAQATQWVGRGPEPAAARNPVYRALADGSGTAPRTASTIPVPGEADLDLLRRQLTARALLVAAVTSGERTHRLRIGLDPAGATLERSAGAEPSHWSEIEVEEVPGTVTALLARTGLDTAPAALSVGRREDALRLSPEQSRMARTALARGLSAEEAFASVPDLAEPLRDALTASGPRLSLSLTLHDPHGQVTDQPVTWSRLWVRGRLGLYRMDQPGSPALAVHPVGDGDVLGSLLPVLEQGLRFAVACTASGGAR